MLWYKNNPSLDLLLNKVFSNAENHTQKVKVLINQDITSSSKQAISQLISPFIHHSLTDIDLAEIARLLETQAWIDTFTIKKHWPDKLILGIIPHYVAARVGDHAMLTYKGDIIKFNQSNYQHLPQLNFPATKKEQALYYYKMLKQYIHRFSWKISTFTLSEYDTLRVNIETKNHKNKHGSDTVQFNFPAEKLHIHLNKLNLLINKNTLNFAKIKSINMNYANGFAVAWRNAAH